MHPTLRLLVCLLVQLLVQLLVVVRLLVRLLVRPLVGLVLRLLLRLLLRLSLLLPIRLVLRLRQCQRHVGGRHVGIASRRRCSHCKRRFRHRASATSLHLKHTKLQRSAIPLFLCRRRRHHDLRPLPRAPPHVSDVSAFASLPLL